MKKKIVCALVTALLLVCFSATALAVNNNFNFYMESGGPSAFSDLTLKNGGSAYENIWYVTPKASQGGVSSNWRPGEVCRFRVRDAAANIASGLFTKTQGEGANSLYGKTFSHPYSITSIGGAYYKLYADKPASDPFSALRLVGTWCP